MSSLSHVLEALWAIGRNAGLTLGVMGDIPTGFKQKGTAVTFIISAGPCGHWMEIQLQSGNVRGQTPCPVTAEPRHRGQQPELDVEVEDTVIF